MLFIMGYTGLTGAVVNEPGELYTNRIQLYLNFPVPEDVVYKKSVHNVKRYLRDGADPKFYGDLRVDFGNEFFNTEKGLLVELLSLSCLEQVGNGLFVSRNGMSIVLPDDSLFGIGFDEFGALPCDSALASSAELTLKQLLALDARLVKSTISEHCVIAEKAFNEGIELLEKGYFEAGIDRFSYAWEMANC